MLEQIKKLLLLSTLIVFGLGGTLLTLTNILITLVLPAANSASTFTAFRVAVFIYTLYSVNAVGYYILIGTGAVRLCTTIQFISAGFSLILIAIGGVTAGLVGCVIGNAGYLGTLLMLSLSMEKIGVSYMQWIKWLTPAFSWFLVVVIANLLFVDSPALKVGIFLVQTLVLVKLAWRDKTFFT